MIFFENDDRPVYANYMYIGFDQDGEFVWSIKKKLEDKIKLHLLEHLPGASGGHLAPIRLRPV